VHRAVEAHDAAALNAQGDVARAAAVAVQLVAGEVEGAHEEVAHGRVAEVTALKRPREVAPGCE
jgi:hypothetical protein